MANKIRIINFDKYLENWINSYNKQFDDELKIANYKSISFCTKNKAYHILQIQPKGSLIVDGVNGLYIDDNDEKYKERMLRSLELSYEYMYDLVLTPEYSVPLSLIDSIIENREKIKCGTLYCLCCNGTPLEKFKEWLDNKKSEKEIEMYLSSLNSINPSEIVCCLIYLAKIRFIRNDQSYFEHLFIVPQFKTSPMKDEKMDFEYRFLSCGEEVIVFGKEEEDYFLSMICADVFNYELISSVKEYLSSQNKKAVIFHPQLNYRPQHNNFRFTRDLLIDYASNDSIRVIALNWAKGTTFVKEGDEIPAITNSWSTIYKAFSSKEFPEYMNILNNFANKGLNFAHDYQVAMFFFPSSEHALDINMKDLVGYSVPGALQDTIFLKVNNYYVYDENTKGMKDNKDLCKEMIDDFFWNQDEYERFFSQEQDNKKCDMKKLNEYISLVYNNNLFNQFEMINNGKISSVTSKHYRSEYSREKLYICKRIQNKLKNKEVPIKFKSLDPSFKYDVIRTHKGHEYNVEYENDMNKDVFCRVVYLKYAKEKDAEKIYDTFYKMFKEEKEGKSFVENMIIYFEDEDGIKLYEKGTSTSILDGEVAKNKGSIIGG